LLGFSALHLSFVYTRQVNDCQELEIVNNAELLQNWQDTSSTFANTGTTGMWANAQRDGRPAEYSWRPLFNDAKFGSRPLLDCRTVTLPRRETR